MEDGKLLVAYNLSPGKVILMTLRAEEAKYYFNELTPPPQPSLNDNVLSIHSLRWAASSLRNLICSHVDSPVSQLIVRV